ncbi:MAG: GAF domain-containing protein [Candidatus Schekmanbacteria bacterium]|nr:GAF domain-containing protein [Candidatus Schekmanbacteria bacterium]
MSTGFFRLDRGGAIVLWDAGAAALTGKAPAEALGRRCYDVVAGTGTSASGGCGPRCPLLRVLEGTKICAESALRLHRAPAPGTAVTCRLTALPGPLGGALGHLSAAAALPPPAHDLAAIATLGARLRGMPFQAAIDATLELLRAATGAEVAEAFLASPDRSRLVLTSQHGGFQRAFRQVLTFESGDGIPGRVLADGTPCVASPLGPDRRFIRSLVKDAGFASYLCVPIASSRGVGGAIGLALRSGAADLDRIREILSWVSSPLSMALEIELRRMQAAVTASEGKLAGLEEVAGEALGELVTLSGAQGGGMVVLDPWSTRVAIRLALGLAPQRPCPALAADGGTRACPVVATGREVWRAGPRSDWPAACRGAARTGAVAYCVPIPAATGVTGVCQLYFSHGGRAAATGRLVLASELAVAAGRVLHRAWRNVEERRRLDDMIAKLVRETRVDVSSAMRSETRSANTSRTGGAIGEGVRDPGNGPRAVSVLCLGPFEVRVDGELVALAALRRRRALTLLKILVTRADRTVPREELIEYLWPERSTRGCTGQLQVLIHDLRRLLDPGVEAAQAFGPARRSGIIRTHADSYRLALATGVSIDAVDFERLLRAGRSHSLDNDIEAAIAAMEAAVSRYRGDFMVEEAYAEWCAGERDRLREMLLRALAGLADLHGGLGNWARASAVLGRALEIDPTREPLHRAAMHALWANGHRDEALRQYRACCEALARLLGVEPVPETHALADLIRARPRP